MKQYILRAITATFFSLTAVAGNAQQVINTFAGVANNAGYAGDNGPATDATLNSPSDVILDASGNVYISDFVNHTIRKVSATTGVITTIAGTGAGAGTLAGGGHTGDGGPATAATLNGPFALALDNSGNLYIADGYNSVVRKVSATGIITNFAGNTTAGYSGDGGQATAANLNNPVGLAVDKAGDVYIADDHNNVIRKVTVMTGIISTVAGSVAAGGSGDGGPATNAKLDLPISVAFDTAGNMFIADAHNSVIRKVDKAGMISTYAGNFTGGYSGDGSAATLAALDTPERIAFDDSNNLYIADFYNHVVRKVNALTGIITTVAGDGTGAGTNKGAYGGDGDEPTKAQLYFPHGIAFDKSNRMYIADRGNSIVRRIGPAPVIDHSAVKNTYAATDELSVIPNPAKGGLFTIALWLDRTVQTPATVSIRNVLGQTVWQQALTANKPVKVNLDVAAGVYMVSATTATAKWNRQLVIE